jgi:membrane protein
LVSSESFFSKLVRRINSRLNRIKDRLLEYKSVKFVLALGQEIGRDDISNLAASVSYYAFLSLFPLLLSVLAIFGLFLPSESIYQNLINLVGNYLPGSRAILENNISDIVEARGTLGLLGILGLLWSGSGVINALSHALNRAWDINYEHPFLIRKPREFLLLFIGGILILLSFASTTLLSRIGNLNLPVSGTIVNVGTALLALFFSLVVFTLVHKLAPLNHPAWRHIWPGAVLSTVLFEIAKTLFVLYLNFFNQSDKIYGSIASVILLLVWIYFSSFILLLGAEFSALLFRSKREGIAALSPEEKPDSIRDL